MSEPYRLLRRPWVILSLGLLGLASIALVLRQLARERDGEPAPARLTDRLAGLNVFLITIDTLRADHLSVYGYQGVKTPNFDALSSEGVRFGNAASTVPFTLPAHSSIMTGTYPPFHGVRENVGYVLDQTLPTLAEQLKAAGYTTAGFVSAFVLDARWGIARGFDHYHDDFELRPGEAVNLGGVQRDGAETVAAAVSWLDGRPPGPFFLWLHLFDPHDPYQPPEPFRSLYPGRPYDGEVAYADALVGRFRQALEERGLLERSILVLTGDHGEGLGDHREGFHGFFVYDATVHVPLLVRTPLAELRGRVVEEPVSHVDLLPTILAALGRTVPPGIHGNSLLPLLLGTGEPERAVYSESYYPLFHYGWAPLRALRTARYKYIDAPRPELYEPLADPREKHNLFSKRPDVAADLKARLHTLARDIDRPEGAHSAPADLDEATLQQLRALGYVAGRGEVDEEDGDASHAERPDPKDKIQIHQAIMQAQSLIGGGQEADAERRLLAAVEQDAGMVDAWQMLGNIAAQRGEHEQAAERFSRALEVDPDHEASLFGLAVAYRELGRLEDAVVGFARLLSLAPHDSKAALATAQIRVDQGRLEDALEVIEGAAREKDAPPILYNRQGELLALLGHAEAALAAFTKAIELAPRLPEPQFNLAVLCEERGELERAMELYQQAIALAPAHYMAQFNLGRLYGLKGDVSRQQQLYEAALASNPDFVRGRYLLAKLLMDRGADLERAETLVREGLERDSEHRAGPLGYFVLADILNRLGRTAEAADAVRRGQEIQAEGAESGSR